MILKLSCDFTNTFKNHKPLRQAFQPQVKPHIISMLHLLSSCIILGIYLPDTLTDDFVNIQSKSLTRQVVRKI